jgi:transcriptional regulator with XRE-family HTH domain
VGQRSRPLRPELSALHLFGARLRSLRQECGLSQQGLGKLVHCSGDLIGKIEKAERRPQNDLVVRCDNVLAANGSLLAMLPADGSATSADHQVVFAAIPGIRLALDTRDFPEDGPVASMADLREQVEQLVRWRLNSRYTDLAAALPATLVQLHRVRQLSSVSPETAALLAQAYRAADAIADKFGLYDLSARIIELIRAAAADTGDELAMAAAAYVRAETFFATGAWEAGRRMLERAGTTLPGRDSPAELAVYGSLHMRAAILAARGDDRASARAHLDEADEVAHRVPEGIYRGTAFGPSSVRIHRLSLAVDLADPAGALDAGRDWHPPPDVPAERRSHFYVDLARAHVLADQTEPALECLRDARRIAPEHIRHHPDVKTALAQLLARVPRPSAQLVEFARWSGVANQR